jgi:hypothetical protein
MILEGFGGEIDMNIDDALDSMNRLANSDKYKDAERRIDSWKERLKHADKAEVQEIEEESSKFFQSLKETEPAIYTMLKVDRNVLSAQIIKKLTGHDVIID